MAVATEEKILDDETVDENIDLFDKKSEKKSPGRVFQSVSAGLSKLTSRGKNKQAEKTVGQDKYAKAGIMDKATDGAISVAQKAGKAARNAGLFMAAAYGTHVKKSAERANTALQTYQMSVRNTNDTFESAMQRAEMMWLQSEAAAKSRRANNWRKLSNKISNLGSTFGRISERSANKTAQESHIHRGDTTGITHVTSPGFDSSNSTADYSCDY